MIDCMACIWPSYRGLKFQSAGFGYYMLPKCTDSARIYHITDAVSVPPQAGIVSLCEDMA